MSSPASYGLGAFVRVDDQHVLAFVEAIHGAHGDTVHGFATNAAIVDDIGQLSLRPLQIAGAPSTHPPQNAAVHESGRGTFETSRDVRCLVAIERQANIHGRGEMSAYYSHQLTATVY